MQRLVCKTCGRGDMLVPDPAGYYCDAVIPDGPQKGAPLACRWCRDPRHHTVVAARKELELLDKQLFEELLCTLNEALKPLEQGQFYEGEVLEDAASVREAIAKVSRRLGGE